MKKEGLYTLLGTLSTLKLKTRQTITLQSILVDFIIIILRLPQPLIGII